MNSNKMIIIVYPVLEGACSIIPKIPATGWGGADNKILNTAWRFKTPGVASAINLAGYMMK